MDVKNSSKHSGLSTAAMLGMLAGTLAKTSSKPLSKKAIKRREDGLEPVVVGDDHDRYMWGGPVLPWMFDDKVELHDAHVRAWEAHRAAKSAR